MCEITFITGAIMDTIVKYKDCPMVLWSHQSGSIHLMPVGYNVEVDSITVVEGGHELTDIINQLDIIKKQEVCGSVYKDMRCWKVVEGDNFNGDYPNEKFVSMPLLDKAAAQQVADIINKQWCNHDHSSRFWRVVFKDYELQGGFEP